MRTVAVAKHSSYCCGTEMINEVKVVNEINRQEVKINLFFFM